MALAARWGREVYGVCAKPLLYQRRLSSVVSQWFQVSARASFWEHLQLLAAPIGCRPARTFWEGQFLIAVAKEVGGDHCGSDDRYVDIDRR